MTPLTPERIAAIHSRVTRVRQWITADACNADGFLPLSVRELFDHDVADLTVELDRLRTSESELTTALGEANRNRAKMLDLTAQLTTRVRELDTEVERLRSVAEIHLTAERVAVIQGRISETRRWISADTCNADGFLPLSVRELLDHDIADLIDLSEQLREIAGDQP